MLFTLFRMIALIYTRQQGQRCHLHVVKASRDAVMTSQDVILTSCDCWVTYALVNKTLDPLQHISSPRGHCLYCLYYLSTLFTSQSTKKLFWRSQFLLNRHSNYNTVQSYLIRLSSWKDIKFSQNSKKKKKKELITKACKTEHSAFADFGWFSIVFAFFSNPNTIQKTFQMFLMSWKCVLQQQLGVHPLTLTCHSSVPNLKRSERIHVRFQSL